MSEARTVPVTMLVQSHSLVSASAKAIAIPRAIWLMVAGITVTSTGGTWDFAWHFSIGRESQFTPPHFVVQMGGILVAIACAYTILATTSAHTTLARDASVRVLSFYGPGGAFIAFWGSVTLAASGPFDNWWHNAYGLDVGVINPPHLLVFLGAYAFKIGALAWIVSIMNRSTDALRSPLLWLFLFVGALGVLQSTCMILLDPRITKMHSAACSLAVG